MVSSNGRRVLWHPRLDNRFIVGNASQVTLYQWLSESSEIKHVTSSYVQDAITIKVSRSRTSFAAHFSCFELRIVHGLVS